MPDRTTPVQTGSADAAPWPRRWPRSLLCQVECALHFVRAIGRSKQEAPMEIRSLATWCLYRYESARFARFFKEAGYTNLLDREQHLSGLARYLEETLARHLRERSSLQTLETTLAALAKLEYALNRYGELHALQLPAIDGAGLRRACHRTAATGLPRYSTLLHDRAYPRPELLIEALSDERHRLQALLQLEGGIRAEGSGAPRGHLKNPLTAAALRGLRPDPVVAGRQCGVVAVREKGGKLTEHFVTPVTYGQLSEHLARHGSLESDYRCYLTALNRAARATGQYAPGRGSHGLKYCFAMRRYLECVACGYSHERALQQTSLETAHFRLKETLTYTFGRR